MRFTSTNSIIELLWLGLLCPACFGQLGSAKIQLPFFHKKTASGQRSFNSIILTDLSNHSENAGGVLLIINRKLTAGEGILSFKYILGDSIYGVSPEFIEAASQLVGTTYFVSVPGKTLCWLKSPVTVEKKYKYKGKQRRKKILVDTEKKPIPLTALAQNTNSYFWYRRTVSEGTKGPIVYEFTRRRVRLSLKGLPRQEVWVIIRRSTGKNPEYSYYISNASTSARLPLFVWLSGMRWAIEQCFEETKSELGMDQYEVRKFPGWHHHIITCMLGHFFLWHLKIRLGKKSSVHYAISA